MESRNQPYPTTKSGNTAYRAALGLMLATALFLVWASAGIGIIGEDGNPANVWYFGVVAVAVIGAILARFRAAGMARAMLATALAQAAVGVGALAAGLATPESGPAEILGLTAMFALLWLLSAWLFRKAARG